VKGDDLEKAKKRPSKAKIKAASRVLFYITHAFVKSRRFISGFDING